MAISIPVTVLTLLLGASGLFVLSRLRTRPVDIVLVLAPSLQIIPDAPLATPTFIMFRQFGPLNAFTSVVLAISTKSLAFALVVFRPMWRQVPIEIEEASPVDGSTTFQTFCRTVLPIMDVPLIVVGVLRSCSHMASSCIRDDADETGSATRNGRIYNRIRAEYAD